MFSEEFLDNLPTEPRKAAYAMCEEFLKMHKGMLPGEDTVRYEEYVEAFAALETFLEAFGLPFAPIELGQERYPNIQTIVRFFYETKEKLKKVLDDLTLGEA